MNNKSIHFTIRRIRWTIQEIFEQIIQIDFIKNKKKEIDIEQFERKFIDVINQAWHDYHQKKDQMKGKRRYQNRYFRDFNRFMEYILNRKIIKDSSTAFIFLAMQGINLIEQLNMKTWYQKYLNAKTSNDFFDLHILLTKTIHKLITNKTHQEISQINAVEYKNQNLLTFSI